MSAHESPKKSSFFWGTWLLLWFVKQKSNIITFLWFHLFWNLLIYKISNWILEEDLDFKKVAFLLKCKQKCTIFIKRVQASMQMNCSRISSEIWAKTLVSGNRRYGCFITVNSIVFTKQSSAERYSANVFSPIILWIFREFLQHI